MIGRFTLKNYLASVQGGSNTTFKILVLLVDFSDKPANVSSIFFDGLIFNSTKPSVKHFYMENSYGKLELTTVNIPSSLGWKRAPQTYASYVNGKYGLGVFYPHNTQKLVEDLVDIVDPLVNFSDYDNDKNGYVEGILIVHAGPGAEFTGNVDDIWSHKWGINPRLKDGVYIQDYSIQPEYWRSPGDMTIGVFSHESGHLFGLPDLYDVDRSSKGIGKWSLMAGGSWNGNLGSSPSHFDAWSKIKLGFVTPQTISSSPTTINLSNVENNPVIYKLWKDNVFGNEYFLAENRQKIGYDEYLPRSGLLIWHIDESKSDNTQEWYPGHTSSGNYKVALEQADGLWDLEMNRNLGDVNDSYPNAGNNPVFSSISIPNSNSYSGQQTYVKVESISSSLKNGENISAKITTVYQPTCVSTGTTCTDSTRSYNSSCESSTTLVRYLCPDPYGLCQRSTLICSSCSNNICVGKGRLPPGCFTSKWGQLCIKTAALAVSDLLGLQKSSGLTTIFIFIIVIVLLVVMLRFLFKKKSRRKR